MEIEDEIREIIGKIKQGEGRELTVYGELAPIYHFLYGKTYDYRGQADIVEKAAPEEVKKICDGGCGSGGLTRILAERYPEAEVEGLDLNQEMLEIAKRKTGDLENIEFSRRDLLDIDENFDVFTIFGTTSHFSPKELQKLFERINCNLTSGGVLVFDYKSPNSKKHEDGHISEWSRETENYLVENPIMTVYRDGTPHYVFSFKFVEIDSGEEHYTGQIMPIELYTAQELNEMLEEAGFSKVEVEKGVLDQSGVFKAWK